MKRNNEKVRRVPKTNVMILEDGEKPVVVKFIDSYPPYMKGEIAGFGKKQVEYLDEIGVIEIVKKKDK